MRTPSLPARTLAKVNAEAYEQLRWVMAAVRWIEVMMVAVASDLVLRWEGSGGALLVLVLLLGVHSAGWLRGRFRGEHKLDDGYYADALDPAHEFSESRRPHGRRVSDGLGSNVHFTWDLCEATRPPPEEVAAMVAAETALRGGPGAMNMEDAEVIAAELDRLRVALLMSQVQKEGGRR